MSTPGQTNAQRSRSKVTPKQTVTSTTTTTTRYLSPADPLKDSRVVILHFSLEAGRRFEFGQSRRVPADVTGHLAAGGPGTQTGQVRLRVC